MKMTAFFNDKKSMRTWSFCIFFLFVSAVYVNADIYQFIDKDGVRHFTNAPTSSKYKVFVRKKFSGTYSPSYYSSDEYDHFINKASDMYDIPFSLLKAVIKVESNFNPRAVSRKGAQGLMQLMPGTAKLLNVYDAFDPWENIMGGSKYLRRLLNRFEGKLSFALAGYNAGPGRVVRYNGIPPIRETQNYVRKVKKYYSAFKNQ